MEGNPDLVAEELEWETAGIKEGKRRLLKELGVAPGRSRVGCTVARAYFQKLRSEIETYRKRTEAKGRRGAFRWEKPLQKLDSDTLALAAIGCILEYLARPRSLDEPLVSDRSSREGARPEFELVAKIAETCRLEHFGLLAEHSSRSGSWRWAEGAYSGAEVKRRYRVLLEEIKCDPGSCSETEWLHLGGLLVHAAKKCGLLTPSKAVTGSIWTGDEEKPESTHKMVGLTERAFDLIDAVPPTHLPPMLARPLPWEDLQGGGYFRHPTDLVRHRDNPSILAALHGADRDLSRVYAAVNALQETAWRINRYIFGVMAEMRKARQRFPGMPSSEAIDRAKARYDAYRAQAGRTRTKADLGAMQRAKKRLDALRLKRFIGNKLIKDRLDMATRCLDKTVYFPYFLDSRGRAYPIPPCFNPQSDDQGRALLEFAEGKPLGPNGARWLKVHLANMWGHGWDKKSFEDRCRWVDENEEEIKRAGEEPLKSSTIWREAKNPWRFLAACKEWCDYLEQGAKFESRVPVAMDGTCNGFQHLSAMLRDAQGGAATNLAPGDAPNDIYTMVARKADDVLRSQADKGDVPAQRWLRILGEKGVPRALAKPVVMTTPYGASFDTKCEQVMAAVEEEDEGVATEARRTGISRGDAGYLVRILNECIRRVCPAHNVVEGWLKSTARRLSGPTVYHMIKKPLREKLRQRASGGDSAAVALLRVIGKAGVLRLAASVAAQDPEKSARLPGLLDALAKAMLDPARLQSGKTHEQLVSYLVAVLRECVESVLRTIPDQTHKGVGRLLRKGRAAALAPNGRPVRWTNPVGFPVVDAAWVYPERKIQSRIFKTFTLPDTRKGPLGIDRNAQARAIVPDFVHSLDAAHMMLTINSLRDLGLKYFAVVHDSYAVHACDVDKLRDALTDTFVQMYLADILEDFRQAQKKANPDLDIPSPPTERGTLRIEEILGSKYCFC
jgi:DNA-directed RNA polymerase